MTPDPNTILLTTDNCRYCLMCRHVCPVGHTTGLETLTPHGWGLLIASERRGLIDWNEDSVYKLFSCADCGTCRAHCVTDQPLPHAIATARAQVVERDLAPAIVYELAEKFSEFGNPYAEIAPQPASAQGDVALFVGDEAQHLRPDVLEAALTLLKAIDIEPVLIGVGRNNGYMASSLGLPLVAQALAQQNIDELLTTRASRLLVLNPGDYYSLNQLYPERLSVSLPDGVTLTEVSTLLAEALDAGDIAFKPLPPGAPYAYVDPSHSVRVTTRFDAPRKLLSALMPMPGKELFWRRERTHPVGSTSLKFANPQFADHLTWARMGDAREVGVQRLFTEDAGTLHTLSAHAPRFGLQVESLYGVLAAQLA